MQLVGFATLCRICRCHFPEASYFPKPLIGFIIISHAKVWQGCIAVNVLAVIDDGSTSQANELLGQRSLVLFWFVVGCWATTMGSWCH